MFSALRQGSLLYILKKGENPILQIGTVTAVSDPQPKMGAMPMYGQMQPTTVNVTVKVGDSAMTFEKLDSGAVMATYGVENTIVSTNRESMNSEVDAMFNHSQQIVESAPYHERQMTALDGIRRQLNPQFAKEKEQEEKIAGLENKVSGMENTLEDIRTMLSNALGGGTGGGSRKPSKD